MPIGASSRNSCSGKKLVTVDSFGFVFCFLLFYLVLVGFFLFFCFFALKSFFFFSDIIHLL